VIAGNQYPFAGEMPHGIDQLIKGLIADVVIENITGYKHGVYLSGRGLPRYIFDHIEALLTQQHGGFAADALERVADVPVSGMKKLDSHLVRPFQTSQIKT
jgi:hypothetical protein